MTELIEGVNCLFEMANLHKEGTGLPYNIWIDSVGCDREINHDSPRLKVDVDEDGMPEVLVSIDQYNPRVLEPQYKGFKHENIILAWIRDNYEVLIAHWEHKLTDKQALNLLTDD